METLTSWIKHKAPSWSDNKILEWDSFFPMQPSVNIYPFVIESRSEKMDMDVCNVVGQKWHYSGETWIDAILNPQHRPYKMKEVIQRFAQEPDYYFNNNNHGDIYFSSLDNQRWFTDGGGNHRTVVAKFAFAMAAEKTGKCFLLQGVSATRYIVDWDSYDLYKRLLDCIKNKELNIFISVDKVHLHTDHCDGTLCEISEPVFYICDYRYTRTGLSTHLTAAQFQNYAGWIIEREGAVETWIRAAYWWQYLFGNNQAGLIFPGSTNNFLTSKSDFDIMRKKEFYQRNAIKYP